MATDNKLDKYRIRVIDRTFDLLDALAASDVPLAASDLCKQSRLSKSTVHRLLMVMETRQMVEREGATHRYRLGSKIFDLARSSEMNETRRRPQAFLDRLAQRTGGTARLAI